MPKHRKHNRSTKRKNREGGTGLSAFFTEVLPFVEKLEQEDHLLLVLPQPSHLGEMEGAMGIVVSNELATEINIDYVARMADYTRQCGSLEAYYDFRARNPKWAAKHNPDQMLLNICRAARYVIAYRYGLALGNAEYAAGLTGTSEPSPESQEEHRAPELPALESLPLFITMMGDSDDVHSPSITDSSFVEYSHRATRPSPSQGERGESLERGESPLPQSIGYELAGEITLEEYKVNENENR